VSWAWQPSDKALTGSAKRSVAGRFTNAVTACRTIVTISLTPAPRLLLPVRILRLDSSRSPMSCAGVIGPTYRRDPRLPVFERVVAILECPGMA